MVCQNCGKNEANVKYTQIVNGVKKEMVLCEECAEKMGISNFKVNMPIHFSNFFDDLFDDEQLLPSFMKENSNTCTNCGEEYDNFIKTGLLGCADCYDMFEDKIDQVLKNMFEYKAGNKTLNEWATAFCERKYNSDFSKEMTNSVQKYIDQFKSEAD